MESMPKTAVQLETAVAKLIKDPGKHWLTSGLPEMAVAIFTHSVIVILGCQNQFLLQ